MASRIRSGSGSRFNPGADNDFMRLFIDGEDLGQCFTTWENYYWAGGPPSAPPVINSLQFRLSVPGPEALLGAGYLFDNVTATASPAVSTDCSPGGDDSDGGDGEPDVDIDKTTKTRSAAPGDLITYRISVRNRGDAPALGLRACDRRPWALRFVRATRRLERAAGGRLCRGSAVSMPVTAGRSVRRSGCARARRRTRSPRGERIDLGGFGAVRGPARASPCAPSPRRRCTEGTLRGQGAG